MEAGTAKKSWMSTIDEEALAVLILLRQPLHLALSTGTGEQAIINAARLRRASETSRRLLPIPTNMILERGIAPHHLIWYAVAGLTKVADAMKKRSGRLAGSGHH
jgi:hypothetical protein